MLYPDETILQPGVKNAGKPVTFRGHFRTRADTEGTHRDSFRTFSDKSGQFRTGYPQAT